MSRKQKTEGWIRNTNSSLISSLKASLVTLALALTQTGIAQADSRPDESKGAKSEPIDLIRLIESEFSAFAQKEKEPASFEAYWLRILKHLDCKPREGPIQSCRPIPATKNTAIKEIVRQWDHEINPGGPLWPMIRVTIVLSTQARAHKDLDKKYFSGWQKKPPHPAEQLGCGPVFSKDRDKFLMGITFWPLRSAPTCDAPPKLIMLTISFKSMETLQ